MGDQTNGSTYIPAVTLSNIQEILEKTLEKSSVASLEIDDIIDNYYVKDLGSFSKATGIIPDNVASQTLLVKFYDHDPSDPADPIPASDPFLKIVVDHTDDQTQWDIDLGSGRKDLDNGLVIGIFDTDGVEVEADYEFYVFYIDEDE